jgi:hypothetical protein
VAIESGQTVQHYRLIEKIGAGGLIAESKGHFDEADYQRQLNGGIAGD